MEDNFVTDIISQQKSQEEAKKDEFDNMFVTIRRDKNNHRNKIKDEANKCDETRDKTGNFKIKSMHKQYLKKVPPHESTQVYLNKKISLELRLKVTESITGK